MHFFLVRVSRCFNVNYRENKCPKNYESRSVFYGKLSVVTAHYVLVIILCGCVNQPFPG